MFFLQQPGRLQAKKLLPETLASLKGLNDLNETMQKHAKAIHFNLFEDVWGIFMHFLRRGGHWIFSHGLNWWPIRWLQSHIYKKIHTNIIKYYRSRLNRFHLAGLFWNLVELTSSNVFPLVNGQFQVRLCSELLGGRCVEIGRVSQQVDIPPRKMYKNGDRNHLKLKVVIRYN